MLGRPLGAQQKKEQRVQNAETAIKGAGSVAHRRGKVHRGYAWRARDVLRWSRLLLPQGRFVPQALAFLGPTHQPRLERADAQPSSAVLLYVGRLLVLADRACACEQPT